jgi:hypothetical protein
VLRFLAEDGGKCVDHVLDAILRTMSGRRRSVALDGHTWTYSTTSSASR